MYSDELEDFLEGYLSDEFHTEAQDGSVRQVSNFKLVNHIY